MTNDLWYIPNDEIVLEGTVEYLVQDGKFLIVPSRDGINVPHFHIRDNDGFNTRLSFTEGSYIVHADPLQKLEKSEVKLLVKLLPKVIKKNNKYKNLTVWKALISEWNRIHPMNKLDMDLPIPDYRHINSKKY